MYFIMHQEYFFFQDLKSLKSLGLFQNRFLDETPHGLVKCSSTQIQVWL